MSRSVTPPLDAVEEQIDAKLELTRVDRIGFRQAILDQFDQGGKGG